MEELFKQLEDFPSYEISSLGRIRVIKTGLIKKQHLNSDGYPYMTLWKGKYKRNITIHKLIAKYFIPNPKNLAVLNHKDGNKLNYAISNLEWCTISANTLHAYENGLNNKRKPILQYSHEGILIKEWSCINQACKELGYNPGFLTAHINGKYITAYGFIWKRKHNNNE